MTFIKDEPTRIGRSGLVIVGNPRQEAERHLLAVCSVLARELQRSIRAKTPVSKMAVAEFLKAHEVYQEMSSKRWI